MNNNIVAQGKLNVSNGISAAGIYSTGNVGATGDLHLSGGDILMDRGFAEHSLTRSLTIGGAQFSAGEVFAKIDFQNYDDPSDYVGARIASANEGGAEGGDLQFSTYNGTDLNTHMVIDSGGSVGIGTALPETVLDIRGTSNWNLSATEGDFRIGNSTHRLKMGVALGGGGAGTGRIYAAGGTNRLILGADTTDVVSIEGSGEVGINGSTYITERLAIGLTNPSTALTLLEQGADNPVGITQGQVGLGSTMELTTTDSDGDQATRLLLRGDADNPDIEFYRGARGAEQLSLFVGGGGNVGVGTGMPSVKLDVDGNARFRSVGSGTLAMDIGITSNGTLTTAASDYRLKDNIETLNEALSSTLALRGVSYVWKEDQSREERIGLIAQEVEKVLPEVVFTNPADGYKGVRYQELVAVLIEAIKEQQSKISTLENRLSEVDSLRKELNELKRLISTDH